MIKNILYIILGVIVGGFVIYLVEALGHLVYPPPEGLDPTDIEAFKQLVRQLPVGAFTFVLLAYALGSFAGGFVTALLSTKHSVRSAMIVGGLLLVLGLINLIMIPHPTWFIIMSLLIYIPCAYFGGLIGQKRKGSASSNQSYSSKNQRFMCH